MPLNRRSFFTTACAAACGAALSQSPGLRAANSTRKLSTPLPVEPVEEEVLTFLGQYSGQVRLVGSGVLAKLHGKPPLALHFQVEVPDLSLMAQVLAAPLPFTIQPPGVLAAGNTLSFTAGGIDFAIDNLSAAEFKRQETGLLRPKNIAFAQDALSYDAAKVTVSDPFSARGRGHVALVNTTLAGASALTAGLRGSVEARALGLPSGPGLVAWHRRNLNLNTRAKNAPAIAEALLRGVATAADSLPNEAISNLLLSRAVSSAMRQVFGLDAKAIVGLFAELRPQMDGRTPNSALWLALLLQTELSLGTGEGPAFSWLQTGTPVENSRSQAALTEARAILPSLPAA